MSYAQYFSSVQKYKFNMFTAWHNKWKLQRAVNIFTNNSPTITSVGCICKGTTCFAASPFYVLLTSCYHYPRAHHYCNPCSLCQTVTHIFSNLLFIHASPLTLLHCYLPCTATCVCVTAPCSVQCRNLLLFPHFLLIHHSAPSCLHPLPMPDCTTACTLIPSHLGLLVV